MRAQCEPPDRSELAGQSRHSHIFHARDRISSDDQPAILNRDVTASGQRYRKNHNDHKLHGCLPLLGRRLLLCSPSACRTFALGMQMCCEQILMANEPGLAAELLTGFIGLAEPPKGIKIC